MRPIIALSAFLLIGSLSGCGGNKNLTCDEPQRYQASQQGERIVAPDGLDELQQGQELAIPPASQQNPRPEGAPCLERPPAYVPPNT
jgi:uncharacterized lipoprotein